MYSNQLTDELGDVEHKEDSNDLDKDDLAPTTPKITQPYVMFQFDSEISRRYVGDNGVSRPNNTVVLPCNELETVGFISK
jgi:hypothetical protein